MNDEPKTPGEPTEEPVVEEGAAEEAKPEEATNATEGEPEKESSE